MTAAPVFLLVEPSAILRSSMRDWLEDVLTGCRILIAATGEDALRLAAQEQPTRILIEMDLPDMPGIEVLEQMRQNLPTARIIATHLFESRPLLERAHSAGANGFIPKHRLYIELLPLLEIPLG
jgi:two-component system, NarL family, invasion response regulator UvrY